MLHDHIFASWIAKKSADFGHTLQYVSMLRCLAHGNRAKKERFQIANCLNVAFMNLVHLFMLAKGVQKDVVIFLLDHSDKIDLTKGQEILSNVVRVLY